MRVFTSQEILTTTLQAVVSQFGRYVTKRYSPFVAWRLNWRNHCSQGNKQPVQFVFASILDGMFMRKPVDFDTESFQFAPEAMKLHKKFDLFKYTEFARGQESI